TALAAAFLADCNCKSDISVPGSNVCGDGISFLRASYFSWSVVLKGSMVLSRFVLQHTITATHRRNCIIFS
ncbi:unnamed protein product, partial [Brassica oleracea]